MRTLLIAGNWKMNPASRAEAVALARPSSRESAKRPRFASCFALPASSSRMSTPSWTDRRSVSAAKTCTGRQRALIPARSRARCSSMPVVRM